MIMLVEAKQNSELDGEKDKAWAFDREVQCQICYPLFARGGDTLLYFLHKKIKSGREKGRQTGVEKMQREGHV